MAEPRGGILGRGWSFPPTFDPVFRTVVTVEGVEAIEQNLRVLLETAPGERTMLPGFGCPFEQFAFADINEATMAELQDGVRRAIIVYEPRITLHAVEVRAPHADSGEILVSIDYSIRSTNSRHNFVHPFHLVEGTDLRT